MKRSLIFMAIIMGAFMFYLHLCSCEKLSSENGIEVDLGTLIFNGSRVGMVEYVYNDDSTKNNERLTPIRLFVIVKNNGYTPYSIWSDDLLSSQKQIFFEIQKKDNTIVRINRFPFSAYPDSPNPYHISAGQTGIVPISLDTNIWANVLKIQPRENVSIRVCVDGFYSGWKTIKYFVQTCGFFEKINPMRRSSLQIQKNDVGPGEL